jgi:hypothetical protein
MAAILNHPKRNYTQFHKPLMGIVFLIVTHVYPISLPICAVVVVVGVVVVVVVVVVVCW